MFLFLTEPELLAGFAPILQTLTGRFTVIVGQSYFGDLFLRDQRTGEYAILIASTLELVDTGEVEEHGFRERILANSEVVQNLLRPDTAAALVRRLGVPTWGEAFIPVPIPALGGSGTIATFEKGGLHEYLAIVAQTIGGPA